MGVISENLEGDRVNVVAVIVLGEIELDQLISFDGSPIDWICTVLLYPRNNVLEVKCRSVGGANWVLKGLKGKRAVIER